MSAFPETPATLLVKLAAQVTGEDEANWVRFADLYVPAIREFARRRGDGRDVDDVVQEVLAGLVRIFSRQQVLRARRKGELPRLPREDDPQPALHGVSPRKGAGTRA